MEKSFGERVAEAREVVTSISPSEADVIRQSGTAVFVDPRPAEAISATTGIIPGAHNVQLGDISRGALPEALGDKRATVITSCQGGPMGAIAAHELTKLGFANVRYVDGGTQGWLDAGLPTVR